MVEPAKQLTDALLGTAASKLTTESASRLRRLLQGDATKRAIRRAFENAFSDMLKRIRVPQDAERAKELTTQLEIFLRDELVASWLVDAAIYREPPPLEDLLSRFEEIYDPDTVDTDFKNTMEVFTEALERQLMLETSKPNSPLIGSVLVSLREQYQEVKQEITQVTHGLSSGHDFSRRVDNFMRSYLGDSNSTVIFGGRNAEIDTLNGWLDGTEAPPCLFLDSSAGRGKSALLVHWVDQLAGRDDLQVVFVPVSIRFRTNLSTVFFQTLAIRLAETHGESLPPLITPNAEALRDLVFEYLERPLANGLRLLVVVDGLDEAADWEADHNLFPSSPAEGVKILSSARSIALDGTSPIWLERLGWESPRRAQEMRLEGLSRQGIADVVTRSIGETLSKFSDRDEIIDELYRLTFGDPLLVELYVDALRGRSDSDTALRVKDLERLQPGLEGYFNKWWHEQERLWGQDSPLREQGVQTVLSLLSCALGPLTIEDLRSLSHVEESLSSQTIRFAVKDLGRFVVGNGDEDGYVFAHPRLAEYFRGKLATSEQRAYDSRFLSYGRDTLRSLEKRTLDPGRVSPYLIQNYGAHLDRSEGKWEDYCALVSEGWMQAWRAFEGWYEGFLNDVERTWHRAEERQDIAFQVRCALCHSSVMALYSNVPPRLLYAALSHNLLPARQALTMAITNNSFEALVLIFPLLDQQLRVEAFKAACDLREDHRAQSLAMMGPYLSSELALEALAVGREISDPFYRSRTLQEISYYLPEGLKEESRAESLAAACLLPYMSQGPANFEDDVTYDSWYEGVEDRIDALANLGHHNAALDLLRQIPEGEHHGSALARISKITPLHTLLEQYDPRQILEALTLWPSNSECWRTISSDLKLAQTVHVREEIARRRGELAVEVLRRLEENRECDSFQSAHTIKDPYARALRQADLGGTVEAISSALEIEEDGWRLQTLRELLTDVRLDEKLCRELLELSPPAQNITDLHRRVQLLVAVGEKRSGITRSSLYQEILTIAQFIGDVSIRAEVLAEAGYISEALATVPAIQDEFWRTRLLDHLTPLLPVDSISKAFDLSQRIDDKVSRALLFKKVAPSVSECLREQMLNEVTATAYDVSTAGFHKMRPSLSSVVGSLGALGAVDEALALALTCPDSNDRRSSLLELIPLLPEDQMRDALKAGLKAIENNTGSYEGYNQFQAVLSYLPVDMIDDAFEVIRVRSSTGDNFEVAQFVEAMTQYLTEEFVEEALEMALQLESEMFLCEAVEAIAPRLCADQIRRALEHLETVEHERWRASAVSVLATRLAEIEQYDDAHTTARSIADRVYRCASLGHIAQKIPEHLHAEVSFEARSAAEEITEPLQKAWALSCVGSSLTEQAEEEIIGLLNSAAHLVSTSVSLGKVLENLEEDVKERIVNNLLTRLEKEQEIDYYIWPELVPHLTADQIGEAYEIVGNQLDASDKALAMSVLLPYSTPFFRNQWIRELFTELAREGSHAHRLLEKPVVEYLGDWAEDHLEEASEAWRLLLRKKCAEQPRPRFLTDLTLLLPLVAVLGKDTDTSQIVKEVFEICAWWP